MRAPEMLAALAALVLAVTLAPPVALPVCEPVTCVDYTSPNPFLARVEIDPNGRLDYAIIDARFAVEGDTAWLVTRVCRCLMSYDVSDPLAIRRLSLTMPPFMVAAVVANTGTVCLMGDGLSLVDGTNPSSPVVTARFGEPGVSYVGGCIVGDFLYATGRHVDGTWRFQVFDIADLARPEMVLDERLVSRSLAAAFGDRLVRLREGRLEIVDISAPPALGVVGSVEAAGEDLAVAGRIACLGDRSGVRLYELGSGAAPVLSATVALPAAGPFVITPTRLHVADSQLGICTWDVADPSRPAQVSRIPNLGGVQDLGACGDYVLASTIGGLLHTLDPAQDPVTMSPLAVLRFIDGFDASPVTRDGLLYAVTCTGANVANRLVSFDVTDPARPRGLANFGMGRRLTRPRFVGHHLVFDRLAVVDVADPMHMRLVLAPRPELGAVAIRDSLAFAPVGAGALSRVVAFDLGDPTAPREIGATQMSIQVEVHAFDGEVLLTTAGPRLLTTYTGDPGNLVPLAELNLPMRSCDDIAVRDHLAFLATDRGGLLIVDISEPASPVLRSELLPYERSERGVLVAGNGVVYLGNSNLGVMMIDVTDPDAPRMSGILPIGRANSGALSPGMTTIVGLALTDGEILCLNPSSSLTVAGRACGDIVGRRVVEIVVEPDLRCPRVPCGERARGYIEVAVLSGDGFDAAAIDPRTVMFGPGAALAELPRHPRDDKGRRAAGGDRDEREDKDPRRRNLRDIDCDGDLDLVLRFAARDAAIACGDTAASLAGATFDGGRLCGDGSLTTSRNCRDGATEGNAVAAKAAGHGGGRGRGCGGSNPADKAGDGSSASALVFSAEPVLSPNPLNPATEVAFGLGRRLRLDVSIYDIAGRLVRRLADREFGPGPCRIAWDGSGSDGSGVASGLYFVRISGGELDVTLRAAVIR